MIQRREQTAIIVAAIAMLAIFLPLYWGWVAVSDLDSFIAAALVAGSILVWGFKDRIEQLFREKDSPESKKRMKRELTLLISPLYANLTKNDEIVDFMTTYKVTRLWTYKDDSKREALEKLEEGIKEIMLQYGPLASDYLYSFIKKFQDLQPDWKQANCFEAKKVLREIKETVKERQDELRTELKSSETDLT